MFSFERRATLALISLYFIAILAIMDDVSEVFDLHDRESHHDR